MDALSDIFSHCRLEGTVFSKAHLETPWGVFSKARPHGIFHAVIEGECWVVPAIDNGEPIKLHRGDVVFLPHGAAHTMCDQPQRRGEPIELLPRTGGEGPVSELRVEGGGELTRLICGRIHFEQGHGHPLLGVLPQVIKVNGHSGPAARWIDSTLSLIQKEMDDDGDRPGAEAMIARLTDVLLVQALRAWLESQGPGDSGWMGGLLDPHISRALTHIHRHPQEGWTVETLARKAGMSRSGFSARFTECVGEPPYSYLKRWRMHLAARALRRTSATLAEIAEQVGYSSEYALSKAFKSFTGQPPAHYRAQAA